VSVQPLSSALKTFRVLDVIASSPAPMRLADIARAADEARGAVHKRLVTLVEAGCVEQGDDGLYRLTLRTIAHGVMAMEQASLGTRLGSALDELVALTGETASIAILDGAEAVIVRRVETRELLRADLRVGTRLALDRTASGRILLAYAPESTIAKLAAAGVRLPPGDLLRQVRQDGVAASDAQDPPSVSAVAAPIFDPAGACLCALTSSGPYVRFDADRCAAAVRDIASRISAQLRGPQR
jgi:IclR family acetate operon transcriptional repressor